MKSNMKIRKKFKFVAFFLSIIFGANILSTYAMATEVNSQKLLFVTDESTYEDLCSELKNSSLILDVDQVDSVAVGSDALVVDFDLFDYISSENINCDSVLNYKAVVLPFGKDYTDLLAKTAFEQGIIVYLYGLLTINDYKDTVQMNDFSLSVPLYNSEEEQNGMVQQGFDTFFENNETYNVISYNNNALLHKFSGTIKQVNYLVAALNNFEKLDISMERNTIIESDFDITTSWGTNNQFAVHLDYTLYKENDEADSTYDYFAIKTRTWVTSGSSKVTAIYTKYVLPYESSNLLETGPASQSNIGSLSVSVGYGNEGAQGSVGYTVDLSDTSPTIERTEDYTEDTVEWVLMPRTWFPKSINDSSLVCVATWASTGKTAAIDVYYQGVVNIGTNNQYPTSAGYTQLPIRFSYEDSTTWL